MGLNLVNPSLLGWQEKHKVIYGGSFLGSILTVLNLTQVGR